MNDPDPDKPRTPCSGNCSCSGGSPTPSDPIGNPGGSTRRAVLKGIGATLGVAAYAKALAPLTELTQQTSMDEFLQKHYKELTKEELSAVLERLTRETKEQYGADVTIADPKPREGVKFGYALNLSICNGCRKCAEACHLENNHDRPSHQSSASSR